MKLVSRGFKILLIGVGLLVVLFASIFGYRDIPLEDLKAKYAPESSSFMLVDGMNVHFRDEGPSTDSIPVVLLHGTGSSLHTFDEWTDRLSSEFRVIRMDLPGYGLTGPFPHRDYAIDRYVDFIQQFLNTLNIDKCVLAGNSLGGGIAWRFAVRHPERVKKLILINASGYPTKAKTKPTAFKIAEIPIINKVFTFITPKSFVRSSVEQVFADKTKVTDSIVDRYFELSLREGNRQAFIDRFQAKKDTGAYQNIKLIEQRTLLFWGEEDKLIPKQSAYLFRHDLQNDTLVIMKDTGHVPMEENPEQSLEVVLSFLTENL